MRINKVIAQQLGISRRKADELLIRGDVMFQGAIAQTGQQLNENDELSCTYKGRVHRIVYQEKKTHVTLLVYKPIFCVTSLSDPQKRHTIRDIIPPQYSHVKPAGRLDYMSEGLLVCSSDGDLLHALTHPKFGTKKTYLVSVKKPLSSDFISKAQKGIVLEGYSLNSVEIKQSNPQKEFSYLKPEPSHIWYSFTLTEGRNNQIRKMISLTGQKVLRLIRVSHGSYNMSKELREEVCIEIF